MDQPTKDEVLATYTAFLTAFRADDVRRLTSCFNIRARTWRWPDHSPSTFPIKPADYAASSGHDTKDFSYEVVFASATKAHLIVRQATRRVGRMDRQ